ncbi:hypothetical protein WJX74_003216 [Apatococcus lobatus]|uniref:Expansin-like EG45 domain-containing protein n=1 Tax=Apatococcus lobatus TaxID=904363 RepID=A0AAW1QTG4_9CHLO
MSHRLDCQEQAAIYARLQHESIQLQLYSSTVSCPLEAQLPDNSCTNTQLIAKLRVSADHQLIRLANFRHFGVSLRRSVQASQLPSPLYSRSSATVPHPQAFLRHPLQSTRKPVSRLKTTMQPSQRSSSFCTAAFLAVCLSSSFYGVLGNAPGVASPLSAWRNGIASLYGDRASIYNPSMGAIDGSCGYGAVSLTSYPFWSIGALSPSNLFFQEGPVEGCGMCFQVQCVNDGPQFAGKCNPDWQTNSITFMVTDKCPECQADQVDLNALAFQKLAPLANGRVALQYRRVTCTPQEPVSVRVDANRGSGGWIRLWVMNTAGTAGVKAVSVRSAGTAGAWVPLNNGFGADWESPASPAQPLDMLVTSDDGSSVTIPNAVAAGYIGSGTAPGQNFAQDAVGQITAAASGQNPPVAAGSTSTAVSG